MALKKAEGLGFIDVSCSETHLVGELSLWVDDAGGPLRTDADNSKR